MVTYQYKAQHPSAGCRRSLPSGLATTMGHYWASRHKITTTGGLWPSSAQFSSKIWFVTQRGVCGPLGAFSGSAKCTMAGPKQGATHSICQSTGSEERIFR